MGRKAGESAGECARQAYRPTTAARDSVKAARVDSGSREMDSVRARLGVGEKQIREQDKR